MAIWRFFKFYFVVITIRNETFKWSFSSSVIFFELPIKLSHDVGLMTSDPCTSVTYLVI